MTWKKRTGSTQPVPNNIPVGVSASPGDGQIILNWIPVTGASGYNLYLNGIKSNLSPIAETTCALTGLSNGLSYEIRVASVVDGVESSKTSPLNTAPVLPATGETSTNPVTSYNNQMISVVDRSAVNRKGFYTTGDRPTLTARIRQTAMIGFTSPVLVYGNFANYDSDGPGTITYRASIEKGDGSLHQVTFGGQVEIIVAPGGIVESDMNDLSFTAGEVFYVRTYTEGAYGMSASHLIGKGDGIISGDATMTFGTTGFDFSTHQFFAAPMAMFGIPAASTSADKKRKNIVFIGDSITAGEASPDNLGYVGICTNNYGCGFINLGVPGETASQFIGTGGKYRRNLAVLATHAFVMYGQNDLNQGRTVDQIKTDLLAIWNFLSEKGIKVYAGTITPRTTSTDGWKTIENQSIALVSGSTNAFDAWRVELNEWIRTTPAPLTGYFDIADAAETDRNSGIWKANYVNDGIHPNVNGITPIGNAIDLSIMT